MVSFSLYVEDVFEYQRTGYSTDATHCSTASARSVQLDSTIALGWTAPHAGWQVEPMAIVVDQGPCSVGGKSPDTRICESCLLRK